MLRAYRLIYTNNTYAPEQLWEWEQPYTDNLSRIARAFGHYMKQRFFLNEKAPGWENLRIWHTWVNAPSGPWSLATVGRT